MNYWDSVDAARQVIMTSGLQMGKAHGLARYREQTEGVAAMIQQAALDFLSQEFKGFPKELVLRDLSDREDEIYDKWVKFADKIYGINSPEGQETGWEMIVGGQYGDPGLTEFPKRGALNQSKMCESNEESEINRVYLAYTHALRHGSRNELIAAAKVYNDVLKKAGGPKKYPNWDYLKTAKEDMRESIFDRHIVRKGKAKYLEPKAPIYGHLKIDDLMDMTGSEIRNLYHGISPEIYFNYNAFFNDKQLNALAGHHDYDVRKSAMDALE